jgi:hypothetical protein
MRAASNDDGKNDQYHGQDLAWWQSCFSAGLVRLLMVQLKARASGRTKWKLKEAGAPRFGWNGDDYTEHLALAVM